MIIGISGKIGTGKDTVAEMIRELSPDIKWENRKFADKLKDMVCLMIGCSREQLEDRDFKETPLGDDWKVFAAVQHGFNTDTVESIHANREDAEYILKFSHMNRVIEYNLTPRRILQLLGTEGGRKIIHPNVWVNALMSEYYDGDIFARLGGFTFESESSNWIITDVRFPNELEAVKAKGGITLRLERPNFKVDPEKASHLSETALDDAEFDYTIVNTTGLVELREQVEDFLDTFGL